MKPPRSLSDDEVRALMAAQTDEERQNARAFAEAAERGDVEEFERLAYPDDALNIDWEMAFREIAKLGSVKPEISEAFVPAWIEHKMWPLQVGDRRTLAHALRVLMPPQPGQEALTLYRGTDWRERVKRRYGFSWTKDRDVARRFGAHWRDSAKASGDVDSTGVVLQTTAPPEAILLVRDPSPDYYDEGEVVVDPFRLNAISVLKRG
jgi:hypothetical protein